MFASAFFTLQLFCLYSTIRIAASLTKFQLVDENGYLDSHFLNSTRNDCILILSFVGVLVALYGFHKKRYQYLLVYFTINVASILLILISNILFLFLEETSLDANDVFCIFIITVAYSIFAGVALKFYQALHGRGNQTSYATNPNFFIGESSDDLELEELEKLSSQFTSDHSIRSPKLDRNTNPDYSWLNMNYSTHYDLMLDRNQYLKKLLKRGP
ncbi:uncharacterized protein LOC135840114 isoform X2 [Planococcus citri]|uniref:uncharacterized protein LOC135840114 isoform X2 n=1 Tax=Planococcus citri TaxID=170843 RepID=UPI0031F8C2D9